MIPEELKPAKTQKTCWKWEKRAKVAQTKQFLSSNGPKFG